MQIAVGTMLCYYTRRFFAVFTQIVKHFSTMVEQVHVATFAGYMSVA